MRSYAANSASGVDSEWRAVGGVSPFASSLPLLPPSQNSHPGSRAARQRPPPMLAADPSCYGEALQPLPPPFRRPGLRPPRPPHAPPPHPPPPRWSDRTQQCGRPWRGRTMSHGACRGAKGVREGGRRRLSRPTEPGPSPPPTKEAAREGPGCDRPRPSREAERTDREDGERWRGPLMRGARRRRQRRRPHARQRRPHGARGGSAAAAPLRPPSRAEAAEATAATPAPQGWPRRLRPRPRPRPHQ